MHIFASKQKEIWNSCDMLEALHSDFKRIDPCAMLLTHELVSKLLDTDQHFQTNRRSSQSSVKTSPVIWIWIEPVNQALNFLLSEMIHAVTCIDQQPLDTIDRDFFFGFNAAFLHEQDIVFHLIAMNYGISMQRKNRKSIFLSPSFPFQLEPNLVFTL